MSHTDRGNHPKIELLRFVSTINPTYFEVSVCFDGDGTTFDDLFGQELIEISEMQKRLHKYVLSADLPIGETRNDSGQPIDSAPLSDEHLVGFRNRKETLVEVFGSKSITLSQMQTLLNEYMWSRDLVVSPGFSSF